MKIIDLHCDTLWKMYNDPNYSIRENDGHISDIALKKGNYAAQCFAVYQPIKITGEEGKGFFKTQYNQYCERILKSPLISSAKSGEEIKENAEKDIVSAILTVENADFLQNDLSGIDALERIGVKFMGLVHNGENCLGYNCSDDRAYSALPLKPFGKEVIERLYHTQITADVSHLGEGGFKDVADISGKPFIASHSGCREIFDHPRNLWDHQIKSIAESGGVVGTVFYSVFLNGKDHTKIEDIILHISHIIKVGGEDSVALGTDFDGIECGLFLENASGMTLFAEELIKRFGYSVAEKICFKNALRVIR